MNFWSVELMAKEKISFISFLGSDPVVFEYRDAIKKADIITFLVEHKEFNGLDIESNLDFCGVLN